MHATTSVQASVARRAGDVVAERITAATAALLKPMQADLAALKADLAAVKTQLGMSDGVTCFTSRTDAQTGKDLDSFAMLRNDLVQLYDILSLLPEPARAELNEHASSLHLRRLNLPDKNVQGPLSRIFKLLLGTLRRADRLYAIDTCSEGPKLSGSSRAKAEILISRTAETNWATAVTVAALKSDLEDTELHQEAIGQVYKQWEQLRIKKQDVVCNHGHMPDPAVAGGARPTASGVQVIT